jgi:LysR family nod box-dependent transcriptional activator
MRLDRFDLNLLVALDVILEECNVTRAGARLNLGQSAASAALARLREHFEDPLLVPVGRRLVRTTLAETLVEPVRRALLEARAALAHRSAFEAATTERSFVVRASDYPMTVFLAEVVRRAAIEAPRLSLDIRSPAADVFEDFERGSTDLLFMPEPYLASLDSPRTRLFDDTHVCMVWADNDLVGNEPLTAEKYMEMGHIVVHYGDKRSVAFEEWFLPRYGRQRRVEVRVDSFSMVSQVLLGTNRIATLHRRQADHFARRLPVRLIDMPFDLPRLVQLMTWPSHLNADPAHAWLRSLVTAVVADLPPL